MRLYLGLAVGLTALLVAASGTAAITRGWVPPWNRKTVHRTRLYGWAQVVMAAALCCQAALGVMPGDPDVRQWGTLGGTALMLTAVLLIAASQRTAGRGRGGGTA
ncbi:hypothetical protein [Streptomyces fradiae]|uniref:hypothetical protein n=1 Tax=Streptomyces fradiae TaxID=1906 RepID=UPI002943BC17|nr:hypothetical protein [Streptomyces fradiae]WOI62376.1 hypothetical protein RYQ63_22140 [Streptomyces fradiae]